MPSLFRLTALATIVAGAMFVVVPLLVELVSGEFFPLLALALLLLLVALPGLRAMQSGADGRTGRIGLLLTFVALAALVVLAVAGEIAVNAMTGDIADTLELVVVGLAALAALTLLTGIVLFTVGMTRAGVFPPAAIWIFLAGALLAIVSESYEQTLRGPVPPVLDILPPLGFVVSGVGLLLLGAAAWRRARAMAASG